MPCGLASKKELGLPGVPEKKEESTSTTFPEAAPLLVAWHTKNEVRGLGLDPPPPACAAVADNAKIPIPASTLKAVLLLIVFPPCWPVPARHVPKRSFEADTITAPR